MVICAVPFCKTVKGDKGLSAHRFPSDPLLRHKWAIAISRRDPENNSLWMPGEKSFVCSKHFKNSDFSISTTRSRLLPQVIPSIFDYDHVHKDQEKAQPAYELFKKDLSPNKNNEVLNEEKISSDDDCVAIDLYPQECADSSVHESSLEYEAPKKKGEDASTQCSKHNSGYKPKIRRLLKYNGSLGREVSSFNAQLRRIAPKNKVHNEQVFYKLKAEFMQLCTKVENNNNAVKLLLEEMYTMAHWM